VGIVTVLERKILGYMNGRLRLNKRFFGGLIHFIYDVLKIIRKEVIYIYLRNIKFILIPILIVFISLILWLFLPLGKFLIIVSFNIILIVLMMGLKVFLVLIVGWSVNSIYSMLGVVRVVIQVISYEVRFFFIFVYFLIVFIEREIINFLIYQYYLYIVFFYIICVLYVYY